MNTARVSIILPVYNAAAYVAGAINSVLRQSFSDFELIIINDGSADNSLEIIKSFEDERIIVINNEVNLGLQHSLNKGLKSAKSEYIARIDADDDWIYINKLQEQVDFLDNHSKSVLVGTGALMIKASGEEINKIFMPSSDKDIRYSLLKANQFIHSSIMLRKSALEVVGFYKENDDVKHVEDYDLWLRLGRVGNLNNLPLIAISYRDLNLSVSRQNTIKQLRRNIGLIKIYRNDYPGYYLALVRNYLKLLIYGYCRLISLREYVARFKKINRLANKLPKILIWESLSSIAGGQNVLLNLISYLKNKYSLTVIVPSAGDLSRALNKIGVAVKFINPGNYSIGQKNILDIFKYVLLWPFNFIKSARLIIKHDIIYVNSTRVLPAGIIGGLIFKKLVIWYNHSLISDWKTRELLKILTKLPSLKKMIAVSSAVSDQFSELNGKTEILYNGVDLSKFKPKKDKEVLKPKNIIVIGDLMPTKGQDFLIKTLASLKDLDYKLKIIGSVRVGLESYETELKELIKTFSLDNKIEFLGRRNDINILLPEADLLILSATAPEACPMVVLEAMACGIPVIVSDLGGTKEIVKDDYVGYTFKTNDKKDLADKINLFFGLSFNKISEMRLNCRREAELKYNLEDNANKIKQIINDVLK